MSDPNHFFHDMIEGIVIYDGGDSAPKTAPIEVPADASGLDETLHHDHLDQFQDPPEHVMPVIELQAMHSDDEEIVVAAIEPAAEGDATQPVEVSPGQDDAG